MSDADAATPPPPLDRQRVQEFARTLFGHYTEDNVGNPVAPYMYGMSVLHCTTGSLAEGGAGLGTCWGAETACRMLADAGFTSVEVDDVPGTQNSLFVCRR
jgi:hypothetical protein